MCGPEEFMNNFYDRPLSLKIYSTPMTKYYIGSGMDAYKVCLLLNAGPI